MNLSSRKKYILLRKVGGFYQCFDEDAYLLFYLFNYKVNNERCAFPIISIGKITKVLEEKEINYIIQNDSCNKKQMDYKKENNYFHYVELGIEAYKLDKKKRILDNRIRTMSFSRMEKLYSIIEEFVNE